MPTHPKLTDWLVLHGLVRYDSLLAEHQVDLDVLPALTEQDLEKLGIPLGDRKRFLQAITEPIETSASSVKTAESSGASNQPSDFTQPIGERRQLTVMFCDLVGSTALSEKLDPEELRALLHDYRTRCGEVISRYEGFVARYVGDGILTYFGWPKAHEEDAERALRAALEIVQAVKSASVTEPLSVRIGIATGPVVVGEQAGVGEQSKLAVGSTPNLAARLQGLAAADQIVIASSTRRLVGNSFELADLGEHELNGISEPVHAWRVMAVSAAASRFEASHGAQITPLVGREQEIGLLLDRWQQAQEGEGQVVLLSGEPGIGKSRILNTLRERLEDRAVATLRFQCSPYYINSAFYPMIDNFERALKFARDEVPESKLDKLEALMVGYYGSPLGDVRFVAAMLSIACEARYGAISITPQKQKDETLRVLVAIVAAAARRQPTAMLYEDVHWADPTSLEALDLLIDRVGSMPLLIVLTHRSEFQPKWGSHGHVTALNLSKLTRAQSSAIVSKLASGKALPVELLEQILTRTDGVPLFVEELSKSILESGELKDAGDHYDYAGAARSITIPATLRDSLMARLDRYAPVKEIAQIGAAIGREFTYELIAAVAPHTQSDLDSALNQLTESGLAFRRGTPPEAAYTFKHALIREAAYQSLLLSTRQSVHRQIAEAIVERFPAQADAQPEVVAHHYTQAALAQAIAYWLRAGQRAVERSANAEAISHLTEGLKLLKTLPDTPERAQRELELQTTLGPALIATKGFAAPEVEQAYGRARELCQQVGETPQLFPVLWASWAFYLVRGDSQTASRLAQELLLLARRAQDPALLLMAHRALATTFHFLGEFALAQAHAEQGIALYDPQQHRYLALGYAEHPAVVCHCFAAHILWYRGYPEQALKQSHDALALAQALAHPFSLVHALDFAAWLHQYRREERLTQERAETDITLATEQGIAFFLTHGTILRGWALVEQGLSEEGIAQIRRGLAAYRTTGAELERAYWLALLAQAYGRLGQTEAGLSTLEEALVETHKRGWRFCESELYRLKGELLLARSGERAAEAETCFAQALDIARRQQAKSLELRAAMSLHRLWQMQGKGKQAHDLLAPIYAWFSEGFDMADLQEAKALLGEPSGASCAP